MVYEEIPSIGCLYPLPTLSAETAWRKSGSEGDNDFILYLQLKENDPECSFMTIFIVHL